MISQALSLAKNPRVLASAITLASAALVAHTSMEEGTRYVPYFDTVGVRTVCIGSTTNVEERRYSPQECNDRLMQDIRQHGSGVLSCVRVPISQTEYEAYADLAFNIGVTKFCNSTLVGMLNAGDYVGACKQILRWVKQPELRKRRQREFALCTTPVDTIKEVPNVVIRVSSESETTFPVADNVTRSTSQWLRERGFVD